MAREYPKQSLSAIEIRTDIHNPLVQKAISSYSEYAKIITIVEGSFNLDMDKVEEIITILLEMLNKQNEAGIESEWLFANEDGSWVKKESQYTQFLERLSKKFGYTITNHHAIRKYFNSYILLPAGIEVADRAKILGHSVETNLKYNTFEHHDYCEQAFLKLTKPEYPVKING